MWLWERIAEVWKRLLQRVIVKACQTVACVAANILTTDFLLLRFSSIDWFVDEQILNIN